MREGWTEIIFRRASCVYVCACACVFSTAEESGEYVVDVQAYSLSAPRLTTQLLSNLQSHIHVFFFFGLSHTLQDTVTSLSPIQLYVHSIECTHTLKGRVLDCHPDCNLHAHKHTQWHVSSTQEDLTKSTQASKKHTVEFTLVGRVMARVWLSGRRTVVTKVDAIIGGMTD